MMIIGLTHQFPSVYMKNVLKDKLEEEIKKINLLQPVIDASKEISDAQPDKGTNLDLKI